MKFGTVTSKSIVIALKCIGPGDWFIFAVSVNNFVYTDSVIIFVTMLSIWSPYSSVSTKNLGNHFSLFSYSPFFFPN